MAYMRPQESREYLLSSQASIARSSRAASITSSIDTVLADSASTAETLADKGPQRYRGFASREAYLQALREFADSKSHLESEYTLKGFYGDKTMDHYMNKPGLRDERKKRKAAEAKLARRVTVAQAIPESVCEDGEEVLVQSKSKEPDQVSRPSGLRRLSKVFGAGRRATVA